MPEELAKTLGVFGLGFLVSIMVVSSLSIATSHSISYNTIVAAVVLAPCGGGILASAAAAIDNLEDEDYMAAIIYILILDDIFLGMILASEQILAQ
jgi:hypothetical protein